LDDRELLRRCLRGEPAAWEEFVRAHTERLTGILRRELRRIDSGIAEQELQDLLQDVWVHLLKDDVRALRRFDPSRGVPLEAWVVLLARNVALDHLRRRGSRREVPLEVVGEAVADRSDAPAQETVPSDLKGVWDLLTPREALVLRLRFEQGLGYGQIARILGIARQTVYSLAHSARRKARGLLGAT
jgi:RNA polymerase sigma-70 factor (ECF subfamily)